MRLFHSEKRHDGRSRFCAKGIGPVYASQELTGNGDEEPKSPTAGNETSGALTRPKADGAGLGLRKMTAAGEGRPKFSLDLRS
jgi:hypothetical protein